MPSVDDRIVRIEFDNASFERKIDQTLKSLAQLDQALRMEGAGKGLEDIAKAADSSGGHLGKIAEGVDHIASRFSALGAVAFSAIQTITQGAIGMAKKLGGDILEPIITGGKRRALNIEQAKFMFQGLGIDAEKAMNSARNAVLGTAYGLDEAAKAAAQLSASGIDAGAEMEGTLKGIAGIAAMTNSSFSEMADVFTSAAGQGKISGYTLERISYRGLNAAAAFAKQTGKTEAEVRKMASEGKISFKEFATAMDAAFGSHAQEANKTYTGSLANLRAAMSRLGAAFIGPQLEQQRDLYNAITPQIDKFKEALTPVIDMFTFLTRLSMNNLIKGINALNFDAMKLAMPGIARGMANIFILLDKIKKIARTAFRDVFPPQTVSILLKIAAAFEAFTKKLTIGSTLAGQLRSIFRGFFSVLSIGWEVIKEGVKFFYQMVGAILGLHGGDIMAVFASIGDFFYGLQQALVKGKGIQTFFDALKEILTGLYPFIEKVRDAIVGFFTGFDAAQADVVHKSLGRVEDRFKSLKKIGDRLSGIFDPLQTAFDRVKTVFEAIWDYIKNFFQQLGKNIADVMGKGVFDSTLDALNTTLLGGITALLVGFFKKGISVDLTGGVMQSIAGTFNQLTGTLKAMQTQIKAEALMKIATAIGILTASVLVLSMIDSAALTKSLTAMAVGFGQLLGAFAVIDQLSSGPKGAVQFDMIAGGMIMLASAMVILAGAVAIFGKLDWGELLRGLVGVTATLAILSVALIPLNAQKSSLFITGAGLILVGTGLSILGGAVAIFGKMDWMTIGKGLLGVGAALLIVGLAAKTMPANMPITGAGLILVGVGLNILAGAIALFGTMDWATLGKGLLGVAGGLVVIAGAMQLMPISLPITGAGLILVGIGLNAVAGAMKIFGSMDWGQIGKGLAAMAGALIILAVATNAMSGAIGGAIAIGIVAVSLGVLADVLFTMADLSWGDLIHGLIAIAAALAVLALAALAIEPAVPAMLGMGAALLVIGGAFALVGAGVWLLAKGLETLAKSGVAGIEALVKGMGRIVRAIPMLAEALALGLLDFIKEFAKGLPALVAIIGEFLNLLITELTKLIPKIADFAVALLEALYEVIRAQADNLVQTGIYVLMTFLNGIRDNIGQVVDTVAEIITTFLDEMGRKVPEIVTSLTNMLINIFTSIAENMGRMAATLWVGLGVAFIRGFMQGLGQQAPTLKKWFVDLPMKILGWIGNVAMTLFRKGWDLINGLWNGLKSLISNIAGWLAGIPGNIVRWIGGGLSTLLGKGRDLMNGLWNGLKEIWNTVSGWVGGLIQKIKDAFPNPLQLLADVGRKIFDGLKNGLSSAWGSVTSFVSDKMDELKRKVTHPWEIFSPSKFTQEVGRNIARGLFIGIRDAWEDDPFDSAALIDNVTKIVTDVADVMSNMDEFNPVITPVLDLTKVAADASLVSDMIQNSPGIPAAFSIAQAQTIASSPTAQTNPSMEPTTSTTEGIKFEQNIYAPEQLSTADIYKNTRNQITIAKEELNIR